MKEKILNFILGFLYITVLIPIVALHTLLGCVFSKYKKECWCKFKDIITTGGLK